MSEAKDDYSGGDKINAAEVNQISENANDAGGFRDDKNAGETINGETLPVPVYQNTSDNEFYKCDANVLTKIKFSGFAISDSVDGDPIDIQLNGIVRGFSGLDEGELYYVQDAAGTIGKTPGTYAVLVGKAVSATELLILKEERLFANGVTTKNAADASGTQNIAHGLGKTPRKIRIDALLEVGGYSYNAKTIYNGTTRSSIFVRRTGGTPFQGQLFEIGSGDAANYMRGVVTFDATNIIITWTKTNSPTGTYNLLWEAEA